MVRDVEVGIVEGLRILGNPGEDPRVCCPPATSVNTHQVDNHQPGWSQGTFSCLLAVSADSDSLELDPL